MAEFLEPPRALSRAEVREVDRVAIEELAIPGVILMENAGLGLTVVVLRERAARGGSRGVAVVCGRGNNGGDGFVLARQLMARGVGVHVALCAQPDEPRGDAGVNLRALRGCGVEPAAGLDARGLAEWLRAREDDCDLVVDAIYGTGLASELRPAGRALVEALDASPLPVIAVDLPSGLCCDTGVPLGAATRAVLTVSFVAPKLGFSAPGAATYTGRVEVVPIGCPPAAWAHVHALPDEG